MITENELQIRLHEISENLNFNKSVIEWVFEGICTLHERIPAEATEKKISHMSGRDICRVLIKDLNQLYDKPIESVLCELEIKSSADIGKIVSQLADKKLITLSDPNLIDEFANIFHREKLDSFLQSEGIKRKKADYQRIYRKIMWLLYIVGTILVLASYGGIVSNNVAWIGWGIAMLGFFMQFVKLPEKKRF